MSFSVSASSSALLSMNNEIIYMTTLRYPRSPGWIRRNGRRGGEGKRWKRGGAGQVRRETMDMIYFLRPLLQIFYLSRLQWMLFVRILNKLFPATIMQIMTGIEVVNSEAYFPKLWEYCPSAKGTWAIFPQLREIRLTCSGYLNALVCKTQTFLPLTVAKL